MYWSALNRAVRREEIVFHEARVDGLETETERLGLHLSTGDVLNVDRVFLATGFTTSRPGASGR